jgi:hypothetical protein
MSVLRQPMASLRLAVATRYWHSARIVLEHQTRDAEFMEPVGHLLSMTAELALKAYLLERGMTDKEMGKQRIQHDLGAILRLCIQHGLQLGEPEVDMILVLRTAHLEHFHRYGPKTFTGAYAIVLPREQLALRVLGCVIDLIAGDPADLRHQHGRPEDLDWPRTEPPAEPVSLLCLNRMAQAAEAHAQRVERFGDPHNPPRLRPEG